MTQSRGFLRGVIRSNRPALSNPWCHREWFEFLCEGLEVGVTPRLGLATTVLVDRFLAVAEGDAGGFLARWVWFFLFLLSRVPRFCVPPPRCFFDVVQI